jgi:glucose-1-phosphate thymidylyltransferase
MIFWPLRSMQAAGIEDVLVVVGGKSTSDILKLLGDGHRLGLRLLYAFQETEGGIADALHLAEPFAAGQDICVVLGDNVLEDQLTPYRKRFEQQGKGARVLLKAVTDPENYGCPKFVWSNPEHTRARIVEIAEKPARDTGYEPLAVIGVYFYDKTVFTRIRELTPSARGELEITDLNNNYAREGVLGFSLLQGWWGDAGASFESLEKVSRWLRMTAKGAEAAK